MKRKRESGGRIYCVCSTRGKVGSRTASTWLNAHTIQEINGPILQTGRSWQFSSMIFNMFFLASPWRLLLNAVRECSHTICVSCSPCSITFLLCEDNRFVRESLHHSQWCLWSMSLYLSVRSVCSHAHVYTLIQPASVAENTIADKHLLWNFTCVGIKATIRHRCTSPRATRTWHQAAFMMLRLWCHVLSRTLRELRVGWFSCYVELLKELLLGKKCFYNHILKSTVIGKRCAASQFTLKKVKGWI